MYIHPRVLRTIDHTLCPTNAYSVRPRTELCHQVSLSVISSIVFGTRLSSSVIFFSSSFRFLSRAIASGFSAVPPVVLALSSFLL